MILSNIDIINAHYLRQIEIDPYDSSSVQPASYDLSLHGDVVLQPGEFTLLRTKERIRLSERVQGQLHGKSSTGREGVLVHFTAGYIDPGFNGTITLECINLSKSPVEYRDGTKVCQIAFAYLQTPANPIYNGRYQNQLEAVPSRR